MDAEEQPADDLISESLKRSRSYHRDYAGKTTVKSSAWLLRIRPTLRRGK
jgi:hypothetical protein